jgi:predicted component of type VI protein secretion system
MSLRSDEERWGVWMVQARGFAKRENYPDAVARMRLVKESIQKSLAEETDAALRGRIERHLARAEELLTDLQSRLEAWRSAITARRQQTIDQAEEEMARPLPLASDQR